MSTEVTPIGAKPTPERRQVRTKRTDADQLELFDDHDAEPRYYVDEDSRGWS